MTGRIAGCLGLACVVALLLAGPAAADDSVDELLSRARAAHAAGKPDEALQLASQAVAKDPANAEAHYVRGVLHAVSRHSAKAVADFDRVLQLNPRVVDAYDRRGSEHFKLGHISKSIADFDKFIALAPEQEPYHWKRGISYYYAGRYEEGRKQFEGYQTVDDNDVENAVWRYLCMARSDGVDEARRVMLNIKNDQRVPMMQIYALYSGRATPDDVMLAVRSGEPSPEELNVRLFYAHLYLGLYYDAQGDQQRAREHIERAADEHKVGRYMWYVARVHAARVKQKPAP